MAASYIPGDGVRVMATMQTYAGSPAMPATVVARVMNPLGTVVASYVPGDGTLAAIGSGVYAFTHVVDRPGEWFFGVQGLGSDHGAEEFSLVVRPSRFG